MSITQKTRHDVYERDKHVCQECGNSQWFIRRKELHHCFPRDAYTWSDRDEEWNLVLVCDRCHTGAADCIELNPEKKKKWMLVAWKRRPKDRPIHPIMVTIMTEKERQEFSEFIRLGFSSPLKRKIEKKSQKMSFNDRKRQKMIRKKLYKSRMDAYKARNDGLSPSQVQYRRQKHLKSVENSARL